MARRNGERHRDQSAHQIAPEQGHQPPYEWQEEGEHHRDDGRREDGVDTGVDEHLGEQLLPLVVGSLVGGLAQGEVVEPSDPRLGHMLLAILMAGHGSPHHIRSEEGGDDRHGHDHRIEEIADDAERESERGDDEGELTDLSHGESAAHGRLERLSADEESQASEDGLSHEDGNHQHDNGASIRNDDLRVDKHAHRHEEDGSEEVFHGLHHLDNLVGLYGLSKDGTHDEGTESAAEPRQGGDDGHEAAQSERHDEQRLVVDVFPELAQQHRDEEDAHHEPEHEEEPDAPHASEEHHATRGSAAGDGRQHHHHDDGQDILEDEHAHHQTGKLLMSESEVVERLVDDGGGTHGEHATEEDAVHLAPPEEMAHQHAYGHHTEDDGDGGDDRCGSHLEDFLEREIQSEGEQGEHHADVGPGLHIGLVDHRHGIRHVRTDKEAGHDVAKHQRLLEPLENKGDHPRHNEDEGKVLDEYRKFGHT